MPLPGLRMGVGHGSGRRCGRGDDRRLAGGTHHLRSRYGQRSGILAIERRIDGGLHGDFGDGAFECQGYGCRAALGDGLAHSGRHYEAAAALGFGRNLGECPVIVGGGCFQLCQQRGFRGDARQGHVGYGIEVAGRSGCGVRQGEGRGAGREFRCGEVAQGDKVAFGVEHVHGERGKGFLPRFGGRGFGKERTGRGFVGEPHGDDCAVEGVVDVGNGSRCVVFVAGDHRKCGKGREKNLFHVCCWFIDVLIWIAVWKYSSSAAPVAWTHIREHRYRQSSFGYRYSDHL